MSTTNLQPLGICQRLFNFIMSKFFRRHHSEIIVEFRHTDATYPNSTQTHETNTVQKGELHSSSPDPNSHQKNSAQGKRARKSVTIKEGENEIIVDKKDANLSGDQDAKANHQEAKEKPPRHWGPLLSVASNINEKSDAFINRKKKAMRRNYSLDADRS